MINRGFLEKEIGFTFSVYFMDAPNDVVCSFGLHRDLPVVQ